MYVKCIFAILESVRYINNKVLLLLFNCNFNTKQSICPDSLPYPSQYYSNRNANGIKGSHNK